MTINTKALLSSEPKSCVREGCTNAALVPLWLSIGLCKEHLLERNAMMEAEERAIEEHKAKELCEVRERILTTTGAKWLAHLGFVPSIAENAALGLANFVPNGTTKEIIFPPQRSAGWWLQGLEGRGKTDFAARLCVELVRRYPDLDPRSDFSYHSFSAWWNRRNEAQIEDRAELAAELTRDRVIVIDEFMAVVSTASVEAIRGIADDWERLKRTVILCGNRTADDLQHAERNVVGGGAAPVSSRLYGRLVPIILNGRDMRLKGGGDGRA